MPVTSDHPVPGAEPVVVAARADAELVDVAVSRETGLLAQLDEQERGVFRITGA